MHSIDHSMFVSKYFGKNDLFNEVANDIVMQINSEIKNAESDFEKIIELDNA